MARVCVVSRVISNFMGSTSSRLKDTMKLALLVLLCNCLCCFSVIVAIITDDMRRQIDRMNNASQPSRPKSQTGSGFDRMNSSGQMEPSQIAHISLLLHPIRPNRRLSKKKGVKLSSLPFHQLLPSSVSVPILDPSVRPMWITTVSKPLSSGITISSLTTPLKSLISMSSDTQNITPSPVDIIVPNARNFSDQVQNLTQDYTTNSSLFNHAIRCNEVARYFYTERREHMHTFFSTYVQLQVGFNFLQEALLTVNVSISTTLGLIDLWLSVTLNELDTITMRFTQLSMVFDITRFLRTVLSRDEHFLSIRFFSECHRPEKSARCPRIRYHKPEILAKFC